MRRLAKIVLALIAAVVPCYALLAAWMHWQLRTVTDIDEYEDIRTRWTPSLVQHFPRRIPSNAGRARLSFFPGFLQGGAYFQLRLRLPSIEAARVEQMVSGRAKYVYDGGDFFEHYNQDQQNGVPTASFRTAEPDEKCCAFPTHYKLYVLTAAPGRR